MAAYEKLGTEVPSGALFTCAVLYGATKYAAGTVLEVCVAPFDAKVVRVDQIIDTAVVGGDTGVALKVDGGTAFDTLQSGAGTKGLIDTYTPATAGAGPDVDTGSVLTATSDATATGGEVLLLVTLQKRVS